MTILSFEGGQHRDMERLLPWYATATLDPDEEARVRAHLSDCAGCRRELAALRATLDAAAEPSLDVEAAHTERDWDRLHRRLQVLRSGSRGAPPLQRMRTGWREAAPWLRVALAAQCAGVVVLAALLVRSEQAPPADASYRTLSATDALRAPADTLLVVFDPRLTDAQLRELLGANHARIVDGPNAAGAFLVAAPPGQAQRVRDALRASPGVAMAERLAPPE